MELSLDSEEIVNSAFKIAPYTLVANIVYSFCKKNNYSITLAEGQTTTDLEMELQSNLSTISTTIDSVPYNQLQAFRQLLQVKIRASH